MGEPAPDPSAPVFGCMSPGMRFLKKSRGSQQATQTPEPEKFPDPVSECPRLNLIELKKPRTLGHMIDQTKTLSLSLYLLRPQVSLITRGGTWDKKGVRSLLFSQAGAGRANTPTPPTRVLKPTPGGGKQHARVCHAVGVSHSQAQEAFREAKHSVWFLRQRVKRDVCVVS
jgi:hypothetical protein